MAKRRTTNGNGAIPATASDRTADRHKARSSVALPPDVHRQLKKLADRNSRPLNWQLRLLVTQALEAEGLWPPSQQDG